MILPAATNPNAQKILASTVNARKVLAASHNVQTSHVASLAVQNAHVVNHAAAAFHVAIASLNVQRYHVAVLVKAVVFHVAANLNAQKVHVAAYLSARNFHVVADYRRAVRCFRRAAGRHVVVKVHVAGLVVVVVRNAVHAVHAVQVRVGAGNGCAVLVRAFHALSTLVAVSGPGPSAQSVLNHASAQAAAPKLAVLVVANVNI